MYRCFAYVTCTSKCKVYFKQSLHWLQRILARFGAMLPYRFYFFIESLILISCLLLIILALAYLSACGYAYLSGYEAFAVWPIANLGRASREVAMSALSFPVRLRDVIIMAWVLVCLCHMLAAKEFTATLTRRLAKIYLYLGLPALCGMFLYLLGSSIYIADTGMVSHTVFGLPYSDARSHFADNFRFPLVDFFGPWVMRRPIGTVARLSVDLLGGYQPQLIMAVQTLGLAFSTWLLGLSILKRWGIFAALCSCSFVLMLSYPYLASFQPMVLALIWLCLFFVLLLDALYSKSALFGFAALLALGLALNIRMGAMFLLPCLLAFLIFLLWKGKRTGLVYLLLGVIILALPLLIGQGIIKSYSVVENYQGANFSYTVAGISLGTDWSGAQHHYADQLAKLKDEKEVASFLMKAAISNTIEKPTVFMSGLWKRVEGFWHSIFLSLDIDTSRKHGLFLPILLLPCLRFIFTNRTRKFFWLAILIGLAASAAFVFEDSGPRVLVPGYILLGIFLSWGLYLPASLTDNQNIPNPRYPTLGLASAMFIFMLATPFLALRYPPEPVVAMRSLDRQLLERKHEDVLWGGGSMAGIIITDSPHKYKAASMSREAFAEYMRQSFDTFQVGKNAYPQDEDFALVYAISLLNKSFYYYIAPPALFERKEVPLWKIKYADPCNNGYTLIPIVSYELMTTIDAEKGN